MQEIKYHHLVDADTEGTVKVPLFATCDEGMVKNSHSLYMQEYMPHYFRLISNNCDPDRLSGEFEIRCPVCGTALKQVCGPLDNHKLGLYVCDRCRAND